MKPVLDRDGTCSTGSKVAKSRDCLVGTLGNLEVRQVVALPGFARRWELVPFARISGLLEV